MKRFVAVDRGAAFLLYVGVFDVHSTHVPFNGSDTWYCFVTPLCGLDDRALGAFVVGERLLFDRASIGYRLLCTTIVSAAMLLERRMSIECGVRMSDHWRPLFLPRLGASPRWWGRHFVEILRSIMQLFW